MEAINLTKKNLVFSGLIFLSIIIWAFFLDSTGLTIKALIDFSRLQENILKLKSAEFLLFVLSFPLTIALTVIHCKTENNKINSFIVAGAGTLLGLIASLLLFSELQEYFLIGIFYLIGIMLSVELIHVRILELKKYVSIRLLGTGIHRTSTFLALGLFLVVAMAVYENKEFYSDKIDAQLLKIAGGEQATEQLNESLIDSLIETQKQTMQQITELEQFKALETSVDPNAVTFHYAILAQKDYLQSAEYKQTIEEEMQKKQSVSDDQLKTVLDSVKQQMPLFGLIEELLWLIEGFAFFSIFLLLSNTVFYALTVIYGLITEEIYNLALNTKPF